MSKRVVLEDGKGNKLYPMTLGKCVATESGETVDGLVSKTQMFSPVITMDSSMGKVGVGNDIDVHSNVKDGAYEECVFEGRTLVNAMGTNESLYTGRREIVSGWRHLTTWTTDWNGWLQQDLSILKPNTTYGLFVWVKENNLTGNWSAHISHSESVFLGVSSKVWKAGETGYEFRKMTTKDSFSPSTKTGVRTSTHNNCQVGEKIVYRTLLIEYQEGMENWGIEYFDGMCHSKMPILRNVGKNLFDHSRITKNKYITSLGVLMDSTLSNVSDYIKVFDGVAYKLSTDIHDGRDRQLVYFDGNKNAIAYVDIVSNTRSITPPKGTRYIRFAYYNLASQVQVEYGETTTTYESYKTNILRTSDEVVLRSVGNVKDTYNALTGEFVKRIGEVAFNGSENGWALTVNAYQPLNVDYINFDIPVIGIKTHSRLYCDTIPTREPTIPSTSLNSYSIGGHSTSEIVRLCIEKSKASTVEQLKTYLQSKPFTIQYELATPKTTIIKPPTIPFAYADGHVILETGSSGQSLLPTLKYSVITGRTGQITQNSKILRQQEKQIASLEDLLLTQIVQMDYERTLLQFDFELNTNGLG